MMVNLPTEHRECHIVAQRRYTCCECGGHIEALDVYQHISGTWPQTRRKFFRTCVLCEDAREWLCTGTDWQGADGVRGRYEFRRLRRHLLDFAKTGTIAHLRFAALRRVVEMNRRRTAAKATA